MITNSHEAEAERAHKYSILAAIMNSWTTSPTAREGEILAMMELLKKLLKILKSFLLCKLTNIFYSKNFSDSLLIVYYTTREVKSWSVQSTCKLPLEPKARVENTCSGVAPFIPMLSIRFFIIPGPKIPHSRFGAGSESCTFAQGMVKKPYKMSPKYWNVLGKQSLRKNYILFKYQ